MMKVLVLLLATTAVASFTISVAPRVGVCHRTSCPSRRMSTPLAGAATAPGVVENNLLEVAKGVFAVDERPVVLYDGVCNMCNNFVNIFLDADQEGKFRFSALQSPTGRALLALTGRSPADISRSGKPQCARAEIDRDSEYCIVVRSPNVRYS